MTIAARQETRIAPRGELCVDTIEDLRAALRDAARAGSAIVVDLAEVTLLSAAALGLLATVGEVRLENPSPLSRAVLEAVGLEDLVTH